MTMDEYFDDYDFPSYDPDDIWADEMIDEYPYDDLVDVEVLVPFLLVEVDGMMIAHELIRETWEQADGSRRIEIKHTPISYTCGMPPFGHPAWEHMNDIPF